MSAAEHEFDRVCLLVGRITATVIGVPVGFRISRDCKRADDGRIFIQCFYEAACTVTGDEKAWSGRKWYLSDHMTDDEIVKTAYAAFKATVEHEVMEGFAIDGQRLFNPHTPYAALLEASKTEIYRS